MSEFCSLDIRKFADKKANYHTHTKRCNHAKGEEREYIEKAIEAKYEILGFSDHAPYLFNDDYISPIRMKMSEFEGYVRTLEELKREYKDDIILYIGLEMEYFPELFEKTICEIKQFPLDYMILGQHYLVGEDRSTYVAKQWGEERYLQAYLERIIAGLDTGYFMYVAHPDIINYNGNPELYEKYLIQLAQELKKRNIPIEVNVNGYRAGLHYPNPRFIEIGVQAGNDFIIGVDAHSPNQLIDFQNFESCVQLVKERGGNIINL